MFEVVIDGVLAYCADGGGGLLVVDVTDPANPGELYSVPLAGPAHGVALSGDYAYVANGNEGLRVLYLDDPSGPVEVGFFDTADFARRVAVNGTIAYVADNDNGVWALAFDPPPTPAAIQSFYATLNGTGDGVLLGWRVVADEPLRGFNVYRRNAGEPLNTRLNRSGCLEPGRRQFMDNTTVAGREYQYTVGLVKNDGTEIVSRTVTVSVPAGRSELFQNSPNPFNPGTTIGFTLDRPMRVTLEIFDAAGRRIKTLIDHTMPAGYNRVGWNGRNNAGNQVGSGIYMYRLKAGGRVFSRKMTLVE